ncbi:serine/threonine protein kinase [Micromonospora pattaloongensis]|uniref:non-specific serine/threonine protein kinase n=1 Tax=Micromonospora pattaloongensis TaxID=405436 RepID=A0A1H3I1W7_9ACTN|nr:Stk1 family PASTA domain-containing Ser/Thr kinase [Micromonospora pattaloongensis]SDY21024.1 serine/threonine protein kinase [Micromonospora pattaloongensis]
MTAQARLLGGRYQVGELLGYGGMAEVHRGRDLRLGRDVAIKSLRTDLARDKTFQERFRREAQNAASLNHPAIVAVYDTGEEYAPTGEALPFIVMEFVNGRTLKEVLAAEGRLMPRRALEITADICAALEFSHRHGIIHRDIKPGNVMLTQNGQVKVMDFGIARALASGATTMTQTSAVIGTAQYLSPEQARGEAVDARSDVYAGGCVLFELLCGHPPFVGDSPVSVAYQHVREDPRAPSDINPDVTPPIDAIVLKALSKNPLNRYQSAGEMRADLLRCANGRPVMATPVLREDETVAMAAAATAIRTPTGATRAIPAQQAKRKNSAWVLATLSALGVLAVVALIAGLIFAMQEPDGPKQVALESFVGKPANTAEAQLRTAGFVVTSTPKEQDDCKTPTVLAQTPPGGQQVDEGSPVELVVCAPPDTVVVPPLVGLTEDDARKQLTERNLQAKVEYVNSTEPQGRVVKVPQQGKAVKKDATVELQVSKGNQAVVPNVVGESEGTARRLLTDAGFTVNVEEGQPGPRPGTVVDQNPRAGRTATKGSQVTIVVTPEQQEEPTPDPSPTPEVTPPLGGLGGGLGAVSGRN